MYVDCGHGYRDGCYIMMMDIEMGDTVELGMVMGIEMGDTVELGMVMDIEMGDTVELDMVMDIEMGDTTCGAWYGDGYRDG